MKKIWIIHSSDYGNSETVANKIADGLKDTYEVRVEHLKNLTPEDFAKADLYGLIVAVRIFQFRSDKTIRNFLTGLNEVMGKPIPKFAYFSTHALKWKKFFIRGMKKTVSKLGCVEEVCTDILEIRLQGAKGPARDGADEKIEKFVSTLKEFMS